MMKNIPGQIRQTLIAPTATMTATPTATATPTQTNGEITYIYDGDGNMVKSVIGSVTTYYPRREYELRVEGTNETVVKYYFTNAGRTAMRVNSVLTWLMVDQDNPHLQSLSHAWEREAPSFLAQGEGCVPEGRRQTTATLVNAARLSLGCIITWQDFTTPR